MFVGSGTSLARWHRFKSMSHANDLSGIDAIFKEHARYIIRALRNFGVREADVEDVAQEVFIVIHRKLHAFEARSTLRTWIYAICLRAASDYRRRAHVVRERTMPVKVDTVGTANGDAPDARVILRALLLGFLAQLDEDQRDVFVLYEIEGVVMREVAEIVDCPLQTAYSRLHSARMQLESMWQVEEVGGHAERSELGRASGLRTSSRGPR